MKQLEKQGVDTSPYVDNVPAPLKVTKEPSKQQQQNKKDRHHIQNQTLHNFNKHNNQNQTVHNSNYANNNNNTNSQPCLDDLLKNNIMNALHGHSGGIQQY